MCIAEYLAGIRVYLEYIEGGRPCVHRVASQEDYVDPDCDDDDDDDDDDYVEPAGNPSSSKTHTGKREEAEALIGGCEK